VFEGRDVSRLSENDLADIRSRRIGFVFQSFNLLARTSALENVVLPLLYGAAAALSARDRNALGRESLKSVGLAEREQNTPSQLSGGQQQRVALARALINRPAVLLADEPTGNLDTRTSHEIMDIIRKLNREQGVTVILVTHEQDIGAYADRMSVRSRSTPSRRRDPRRLQPASKPPAPRCRMAPPVSASPSCR
jgi:macrolide transport system ATP-binding/permease protein